MGTPSTLIAKLSNGRYISVYANSDGYPSYMGKMLEEHYTSQSKIEQLLALGSLSRVCAECDAPPGHSYATPAKDHSIAFHRDRGEDWEDMAPAFADTLEEILRCDPSGSYLYMWDGESWRMQARMTGYFVSIAEAIEYEENED